MAQPYNLTVVQPSVRPVFKGGAFRRDALEENLELAVARIRTAARWYQSRVIVFPEFFLHGFTMGVSSADWIFGSVRLDGPELASIGRAARDARCYVAGMVYEVMGGFPGRFWNTAFIVGPDGSVQLTYRKLYAMTGKTRPGDVYAEYVRRHGGPEALFPVLDTPYGRLGCLVCYDINFPEVTRCLALRGAEVFLHVSSETRSPYHLPDGGWTMARRVRAYENIAYLAMANCGPQRDGDGPPDVSHGESQIVDFNGRVMNMATTSNETMITAEIDLEALRRRRARPSLNFLAELSPGLHAPVYAAARNFPLDHWAATPMTGVAENRAALAATIADMTARGVLVAPEETPAGGRLPQQE